MNPIVVIPARLASTRLPDKPLAGADDGQGGRGLWLTDVAGAVRASAMIGGTGGLVMIGLGVSLAATGRKD